MRLPLTLAALLGLAACATEAPREIAPPDPRLSRADCYTVVLFDDATVRKPAEEVPAEHAAFLGEWRYGAWDGEWCHDLIVTEVEPGGTVRLMDLHAPHEPWGKPATAFARTGRITQDGLLVFRHGVTQRSYRVIDGRLHAHREASDRDYRAVLERPEVAAADVIDLREAAKLASN
ncbi:MAG: hypothetical protein ACFBWO_13805 [Paracoccaceae bacterium]